MKKQEMIKVVVVEPRKKPRIEEIKNELLDMQLLVDGFIECVHLDPYGKDVKPYVIVCNEEAKLNRRELNRGLYHKPIEEHGKPYEIIAGTFFIAADDWEAGEFISLDDKQLEEVLKRFEYPEEFLLVGNEVVGIQSK